MSAKRMLWRRGADGKPVPIRRRRTFPRDIISPSTMRAYLYDESLRDHDFLKKLTREQLLDAVGRWIFHTSPRHLQLVCFLLAIDYSGFCFFVDMGGGKTKIMLDTILYRKSRNKLGKTLVVVPYPVNTLTWTEQAKTHAPGLRVVRLVGSKADREALLEEDADVYVINYLGLFVFMCDLVRELTDAEKKQNALRDRRGVLKKFRFKTGRRINDKLAAKFAKLWDCVIFDETQFMGGHDSDQFVLCRMLSTAARFSYVLTGTPTGKDPANIWSQFYCADLGQTFGKKFTLFRSVFYDTKEDKPVVDYKFTNSHEADLHRMMKNRSITFTDSEFSDLPPVTRQKIFVNMTPEMQPYYDRMRTEMIDLQRGASLRLIENKHHQMRAITSGYVIGDIDTGEGVIRVRSRFDDNPKLEAMRSLILGLPENRKITIYHHYVYTGDMIDELAKSLKIGCARLGGGRNGERELTKFLEDDNCRILNAQAQAGGVGTNLQHVCNYCCYFETPNDPIVRRQSEKRFPREGQKRRVFLYDLVMRGTVDEDVLSDLESGMDFMARLLSGKRETKERPRV